MRKIYFFSSYEKFGSVYFGGLLILLVLIMSWYWLDANYADKLRDRLDYDTLYWLLQITLFVLGLMYLNPMISKQLAKNKTIQKWYISYKAREWRRSS